MILEQPAREATDDNSDLVALARRDAAEIRSSSTPHSLAALENPSPPILPGYAIVREIHRGGQGVVYQAVQESTGQTVAVKLLRADRFDRPAHHARFEREIEILAEFQHPQIVSIRDTGVCNGQRYIIMDFIDGEPIDQFVVRSPPALDELLRLFAAVCDAVNAAHLRGVIHRDLKPANILVISDEEEATGRRQQEKATATYTVPASLIPVPSPKILDFGLAKLISDDSGVTAITQERQFLGSLPWSSPEQAAGDHARIDLRTDVYSLGVVLYQLLTGTFPHDLTGTFREVTDRIIRDDPAPPRAVSSALNPSIPQSLNPFSLDDELETLVLKCLAKDRDRRYQTAGELRNDVQRYLNDEPIEAKRDSRWYVLRKTLRRHRAAVTAAAAFLLLILCGTVVSTVFWQQAEAEAENARQHAIRAEANEVRAGEQAARADREAADAREQATKASLLASFLRTILGTVKPELARGQDTALLRDILRTAGKRIDAELGSQPDIAGEMHTVIGQTLVNVGQFADAEPHLTRALELRRTVFGDEHVKTLLNMLHLAQLFGYLGRYSEAEPLYQRTLEGYRRALGDEDLQTLRCLSNLAAIYREMGRPAEAEPLWRRVLEARRRLLPEHDPDIATVLSNLGIACLEQGRDSEAQPFYEEALRIYERSDRDHPNALGVLSNLGSLYNAQGREVEGESLLLRALDGHRRIMPDHPQTAVVLLNLAALYSRQERWGEAEPLNREAAAIQQRAKGNTHPDTLQCKIDWCQILTALRRYDEAEPLLRDVLDICRQTLPTGHALTARALASLGRMLLESGRPGEAEPFLRECTEIRGKAAPGESYLAANAQSLLGGTVAALGRFAEAEPLLLGAYAAVANGAPSRKTHEALERIVKLYESWDAVEPDKGYAEKAAEWRAKQVPLDPR